MAEPEVSVTVPEMLPVVCAFRQVEAEYTNRVVVNTKRAASRAINVNRRMPDARPRIADASTISRLHEPVG
jgi:hypothetical protein